MESLDNYRQLLARVDALSRKIEEEFRPEIACRRGCDACCRHLNLFWVEAVALALALEQLPEEAAEAIRERARRSGADAPCPLLEEGACLLYADRPIICRTHGLPLLLTGDGGRRVDYCPENFRGVTSLPSAAVIDLERLNATLSAVNALFVSEVFHGEPPEQERLSVAEALQLEL